MQKTTKPINRVIFENLAWFLGCLGIAFIVWMVATTQLNPVEERRLRDSIPIRVTPDEGLVITNDNEFSTTASVLLRAQQSVWELLAGDDVIVWADLSGLGPGEHTVPLQAQTVRAARVVDISPAQITVELEAIASKLVEVRPQLNGTLPPGYVLLSEPVLDVTQVTVTGPASLVEQVAAVQVPINQSQIRGPVEDFARPVPVDADGNTVSDVSVDTQVVGVTLEVGRED
jgi:YbbR domain-containing protein